MYSSETIIFLQWDNFCRHEISSFFLKLFCGPNISSKNLNWKMHFYSDASRNYLLLNIAVLWACISRRKRGRGGTDEKPLSDKPPLIRCGETYSTWQQKFKFKFFRRTAKVFLLKRWKKNVLYFVLLNLMKTLLQNYRWKGDLSV